MGIVPEYRDYQSPFNEWSSRLGWVWLLILLVGVVLLQQVARSFRDEKLDRLPAARASSEAITDPGIAPLTVASKSLVKLHRVGEEGSDDDEEASREEARQAIEELEALAESRVDRLRLALVAGELLGRASAIKRLTALATEAGPESTLAADIDWLKLAYEEHATIPDEARASLIARHGWFARLALCYGQPDGTAERHPVVGRGERIAVLGILGSCTFFVTGGLAVFLMVGTIVALKRREWESDLETTSLPGTVYLETFLVFLLLFAALLGLQIFTLWLTGPASVAGLVIGDVLLWLLPLSLLWPRLRGLDWSEVAADLGLTSGAGWPVEIKAGVFGYLASLPVVLAAGYLGRMLEHWISRDPAPGKYSAFESTLGNSWAPVLMGAAGTMVWAPITEEMLTRGALYRALRSKLGVFLSVAISAVIFGAIHPYSTAGILTVTASGVMFALVREWRGSLIAPVTAHFMNNATITGMQIMYLLAVD